MNLQEVGGGCGDWMELAQDRDRWRACSTYGVESRGVYRVLVGKSEKGDHLEDPDLGGRIMVR